MQKTTNQGSIHTVYTVTEGPFLGVCEVVISGGTQPINLNAVVGQFCVTDIASW